LSIKILKVLASFNDWRGPMGKGWKIFMSGGGAEVGIQGGVVSEWTYKYFRISGKSSEWATRTAADGVTPWNCATSTRPHPVSAVWAYPTFYAIPLHLSNQFRNNVLPRTPFRMPSGRVEVQSIDPAAYAKPHRSVPIKNQPLED
jgi:hypothetical protein